MRYRLKWISVMTAIAVVLHLTLQAPLGWLMIGVLLGLPIMGILITLDDDLPGGWSNPDGKTRQMWSYGEFWGELILSLSASMGGFAIDSGWHTREGIALIAVGAVGAFVAVNIIRRWPFPQHDG